MPVVTLPMSKATVTLREPSTLRVKDRKRVVAAANDQTGTMQALSVTDGLIAALVVEWSLDLIIPSVRLESLDEMEIADYDYLAEFAKDAIAVLFPQTERTLETANNPLSPFDKLSD